MLFPAVELAGVLGFTGTLEDPSPRFHRSSKLPDEAGFAAAVGLVGLIAGVGVNDEPAEE